MKNSWKGVMLSGLVFPGLGQVVLKYYIRGFLLIFACWVVGIIDAYRIGKKQDQVEESLDSGI